MVAKLAVFASPYDEHKYNHANAEHLYIKYKIPMLKPKGLYQMIQYANLYILGLHHLL